MQAEKKFNILSNALPITFLLGLIIVLVAGCVNEPPKGSKAAQAMRGKEIFTKQCAPCHGVDTIAPLAENEQFKAPDLTKIMERRRTREFPIGEVAMFIDGRQLVKAHGPREMPVWGEVYKAEGLDENEIKGRKGELVAYLMSIQE